MPLMEAYADHALREDLREFALSFVGSGMTRPPPSEETRPLVGQSVCCAKVLVIAGRNCWLQPPDPCLVMELLLQ